MDSAAWIYLSPHFDDVALSCGGLLWEQAQRGIPASVWTICAGDPPDGGLSPFAESLHRRWQNETNAPLQRRQEDIASCRVMGATHYHFNIRDCIYRTSPDGTPLYPSESAIFGPVHALEAPLQEEVSGQLRQQIPQGAEVVAPLSLGGHSDHRLVRQAAERLRRPLWFYLDYPYILKNDDPSHEMVGLNWTRHTFPISESGLEAWCEAIAAHASQISSFWPDLDAMRAAIRRYCESNQGIVLWKQEDRYES